MNNIRLSCEAEITANIQKQVSKNFSNYTKLMVQFANISKSTPNYISCTMHGSTSITTVKAHLIFYGVKEWSDSVNPEVYDNDINGQMFEYKNKNMQMKTNIDMGGNTIKNLKTPILAQDAINNLEANFISKNGGK